MAAQQVRRECEEYGGGMTWVREIARGELLLRLEPSVELPMGLSPEYQLMLRVTDEMDRLLATIVHPLVISHETPGNGRLDADHCNQM